MKRVYAAIGHFIYSEDIICLFGCQATKKLFQDDLITRKFDAYAVLTEQMIKRLMLLEGIDRDKQIMRLISNYGKRDDATYYFAQCSNIIVSECFSIFN